MVAQWLRRSKHTYAFQAEEGKKGGTSRICFFYRGGRKKASQMIQNIWMGPR